MGDRHAQIVRFPDNDAHGVDFDVITDINGAWLFCCTLCARATGTANIIDADIDAQFREARPLGSLDDDLNLLDPIQLLLKGVDDTSSNRQTTNWTVLLEAELDALEENAAQEEERASSLPPSPTTASTADHTEWYPFKRAHRFPHHGTHSFNAIEVALLQNTWDSEAVQYLSARLGNHSGGLDSDSSVAKNQDSAELLGF
ncbi:hypothetical protein PCANC_19646 [Puccinia coronata f. sp. avenae]|uniref:Uncharacterized protein n=1 Tax=Puccinia coronata f. sp. avenae TaxID=200324 RepID=A0A2N5U2L2_9BASI|nr:hypothetical protein PCASD_16554 [Puccinia coronata f. sp. avenae]PLW37371.1 hypothetical protein PCANC_19646 [Puccinia coronata f. sp. avenae]